MRRARGRVSIAQVVGLAVLAAGLYFGFKYLPVLTHRMGLADVARGAAARMVVDLNDAKIREQIHQEARARTGVQIGMSELFLERKTHPVLENRVTIRWTEQIKHPWSKSPHVIKMEVTETAAVGNEKVMKNAQ